MERAITKLKKHKSPGNDSTPGDVTQAGGDQLARRIYDLCQTAWMREETPDECTQSVIVTIPKKDDLRECSNYRTISLMSHVGKIMMTVMLERLKSLPS